jgi:hypothetical protein
MTLEFLTQTDVDEALGFTMDAIAAVMLFPDDLPTAKAWIDMQTLLRDCAMRETADRRKLLGMVEGLLKTDVRGLQQRADRAHGDGLATGIYTRLSFELGSTEAALKKTRQIAGSYGYPYDKDISRSKHHAPAAALWAATTHFLSDKLVPCRREHLAEWLGAARGYQLELETAGRKLMRIPDHLRLPTWLEQFVVEQVGALPLDKRMRQRKALRAAGEPFGEGLPL